MKLLIILLGLVASIAGDVRHLPLNKYWPPSYHHHATDDSYYAKAASVPAVSYLAPTTYAHQVPASSLTASFSGPASSYHDAAAPVSIASYTAPVQYVSYSATPAEMYETTFYKTSSSEPAHIFSDSEGYHYKTTKHQVYLYRRDMSHLSKKYLSPHQGAASSPSSEYLAPVGASATIAQYQSVPSSSTADFVPAISYSSHEAAVSEPAHSYSFAEGYRYKTARRRVTRRRRF